MSAEEKPKTKSTPYNKKYYEKSKDRRSEYYKTYYEEHKEEYSKRSKIWREKNKGPPKRLGRPRKHAISPNNDFGTQNDNSVCEEANAV